jgi:phage FluMu protein Com
MKTSKKILYALLSFLIIGIISGGLSIGFELFFGFAFWKTFFFISVVQFVGPMLWNKYYESAQLINLAKEYAAKPFKRYMINLNCAHCGQINTVEMDLAETEFKCTNCKKDNGIHIEFMTAAITVPVSETNFL